MNKILKSVYAITETYKKTGLELPKSPEKMIEELTEKSYQDNIIENLVNISDEEVCIEYLTEYDEDCDYEVITCTKVDKEGHEFRKEEDYIEYIEEKVREKMKDYKILESKDDENKTVYRLVHPDGKVNLISLEGNIIESSNDEDDIQSTLEIIRDGYMFEYQEWNDLDSIKDTIYYNHIYKPGKNVSISSAIDAGLGVLDLHGEEYLFQLGIGNNISDRLIQYFAYAENTIPAEYIDKLDSVKQNLPKDEFKNILEHLGVDIARLSNL